MKTNQKQRRAKTTTADREKRLLRVHELLLQGKSRPYITDYCGKEYGIKRSATDALIQEASNQIMADIEMVKGSRLAIILGRIERIYEETMNAGNQSVARQANMDEAKLLGLEKTRVAHSIEIDEELSKTDDDSLNVELGIEGD